MKLQKVHASLHNEHDSTTVAVHGKEHSLANYHGIHSKGVCRCIHRY